MTGAQPDVQTIVTPTGKAVSSCLTQIMMMEATDQGPFDDFAAVGRFDRPCHRTIMIEGSMGTYWRVIFEVGFENMPQLPFAEHDHSIQAFTPN
jgi:hypothetical protein